MSSFADVFQINSNTGEIRTVPTLLINRARPEPYVLEVTATDKGYPPNAVTIKAFITITESARKGQELIFVKPPMKFSLKIKEVRHHFNQSMFHLQPVLN